MNRCETQAHYLRIIDEAEKRGELNAAIAKLGREDLFYLLCWILNRRDIDRDWLFDRCREVQANPNGYLDIWAREHYKSSVITFGLTIQDILNDPEITIGIFSLTRPIAKGFLRQIKREFEENKLLKQLYPEILWNNPEYEAPKWSEDEGIIVRRKGNPNAATVEAWGLVDAMPTSKHFNIRIYDDIIDERNVGSPDMIEKAIKAWALSQNLGSAAPIKRYKEVNISRYAGTRYHFCFIPSTRIMMGDWSNKRIDEVKPGDEVVGWVLENKKRWLRKTRVIDVGFHDNRPVKKYTFSCGRSVVCTPDHKWWRGAHGGGAEYRSIGLDGHKAKSIARLCDPADKISSYEAGWLSGFYDGEGTLRKNTHHPSATISICQSDNYPNIIDTLRETLISFNYKWKEDWIAGGDREWNKNHADRCNFVLYGGWRERYRFLREIAPAKSEKIIASLYGQLLTDRVTLINEEDAGTDRVYWISTETGNYIAEGFCSKNSDPYREIMKRGSAIPRIYPGTKDGKPEGEPVLWARDFMDKKRRDLGSFVFACQILCNPVADEAQGFKREWIRYWNGKDWVGMNIYLLCDPAGEKKKTNDYTVMLIIGLGADRNYYLIDGIRDRLNLTERTKALFTLHRKYLPVDCGYEKYGKDSDIEHITEMMDIENYRFEITPLGGATPKNDRIRKLIPDYENHRWFIPQAIYYKKYDGKIGNLVDEFLETEYDSFPVAVHDDIFDCMARIKEADLNARFPMDSNRINRPLSLAYSRRREYDPFVRLSA